MRCALLLSALLLSALVFAGCGYPGDTQPPSLGIPNRVTDLVAVERGSKLVIQFTIPKTNTDGLPLKEDPYLELHIGNRKLHVTSGRYETDAAPFYTQTIKIAVRVQNDRGRDAGWSNIVDLNVTPALSAPTELAAKAVPDGVQLTWRSGERQFLVFRQGPGDSALVRLGTADARTFTDEHVEFGRTYKYAVKTINPPAESDLTEAVTITPKDTFAPAVPVNVSAVAGSASVELIWDRVTSRNLAGYRIYRDGKKAGETNLGPSFSDRTILPGQHYRYTVTSFDRLGNESAPSPAVEVST
ncbi:MAG: hypothetical protein M3Z09_03645 [Acidobacteriota bacterium]|nr:hypothetical protein [Acidobacteriota bacterium]